MSGGYLLSLLKVFLDASLGPKIVLLKVFVQFETVIATVSYHYVSIRGQAETLGTI